MKKSIRKSWGNFLANYQNLFPLFSAMKSFDDQKTHEFLSAANLKTKNLKETKEFTKILQIILCQQDLIHIFYADKNNRMEDIIFKEKFHNYSWTLLFRFRLIN